MNESHPNAMPPSSSVISTAASAPTAPPLKLDHRQCVSTISNTNEPWVFAQDSKSTYVRTSMLEEQAIAIDTDNIDQFYHEKQGEVENDRAAKAAS